MPTKSREKNRQYQAKWYEANKATQMARVKAQRKKIQAWFNENKRLYSCRKCGQDHPAAIDFHHNDPSQKETNLSRAVLKGWGKEKILAEIAKCTPLCATCHRIFHFELEAGNTPSIEAWLS